MRDEQMRRPAEEQITLAHAGFRLLHLTMFPTADMIPSLVIVLPVSYAWTAWIMPLLG